jgi:hypothetical protein
MVMMQISASALKVTGDMAVPFGMRLAGASQRREGTVRKS